MQDTKNPDEKFWEFIFGDDLDFYEDFIINLSDEEQKTFFADNPDFMMDFPVSRDKIFLLRDSVYRGILHKIQMYERGKKMEKSYNCSNSIS